MASLSTHVLDTSAGRPATGLRVTLESANGTAHDRAGRAQQDLGRHPQLPR